MNWYLSRNLRASLNYEATEFEGGAAARADRDDEKVLFTRGQVSW